MTSWPIYTGSGVPHNGIEDLPDPPNWRSFSGGPPLPTPAWQDPSTVRRLGTDDDHRVPDAHEIQMINAALFLRRPLLVTGRPGTGKSTLAYAVSKELRLGPVLRWPITSRSTLQEGLYRYDPIGRLREENLRQLRDQASTLATKGEIQRQSLAEDIGRHLRLGPLGTALLPFERPRVLLIDEIDKSDIDLPNDLLNIFEEGEYQIDELARLPGDAGPVTVMTEDAGMGAAVQGGQVQCREFPFVVLTSNGERDFPPAFLRRCLRLDMNPPTADQLRAIVNAHLGPDATAAAGEHLENFLARRERAEVTTDQLLNAVYLATAGSRYEGRSVDDVTSFAEVVNAVMQPLAGLDAE